MEADAGTQYWFCVTPAKGYVLISSWCSGSTPVVRILSPQKAVVRFYVMRPIVYRGVEQLVARQAHNLEVARSNRASATNKDLPQFIVRSVKTLKHSGWACHARQTKSKIILCVSKSLKRFVDMAS